MVKSKKIIRFFTSFLLIFVLCLCDIKIYKADTDTSTDSSIEILSTNNKCHDIALKQIENLVMANYNENIVVYVNDYISVYNAQDENLYFIYPIYVNNKCEYIAEVSQEGTAVLSSNTTLIDNLKKLTSGKYILYIEKGNYYVQNESENKLIAHAYHSENTDNTDFSKFSYEEKILFFREKLNNGQISFKNIETNYISEIEVSRGGLARSVVSGSDGNIYTSKCNITNFVYQGAYDLCWSAASATIINYKKGLSLSAKYLADKYHIGYGDGASAEQIQTCLSGYGLSYTIKNSKIQWAQVKSNISSDKPFIIWLTCSKGHHTLTGYGYSCELRDTTSSVRTVYAWDPNGYQISFLDSESLAIITSGRIFSWSRSIY